MVPGGHIIPADALYRGEGGVDGAHDPARGGSVRREEDLAADEGLHLAPQETGQPSRGGAPIWTIGKNFKHATFSNFHVGG